MLQTLDDFVPSVRSRHPIPAAKQAQIDRAIQWLATTLLVPAQCPVATVTEIINFSTAKGQGILSKYDPTKLQTSHSLMRSLDRVQFVGELRQDLYLRQAKARKCEEILKMIAATQNSGDGECEGEGEDWQTLNAACQRALENTEQLEARLVWCEENFETGKLTSPELRIWGGGEVEIDLEEGERGRSLRRAKRFS